MTKKQVIFGFLSMMLSDLAPEIYTLSVMFLVVLLLRGLKS